MGPSLVFLLSLNPTEGMEATEEDTGAMEDTEVMVATEEDTMAKDLLKLNPQLNPQLNPLLNLLLTHTMEDMAMEAMEDMVDTMDATEAMVVMAMDATGVKHSCCENFGLAW